MRRKLRHAVAALACAALLAGCLAGCSGLGGADGGAADDTAAADGAAGSVSSQVQAELETHGSLGMFEGTALDGETFTQADLAKTDVTVFNFWSTTCGPCVSEMDDLAAFAERLPANVQVVNVCLDGSYNAEQARQILEAAGFDGVTLVGGTNGFLDLCRSVQYTPTRVLVTGSGVVVGDALVGALPDFEGTLLAAVNEVMAWLGEEDVVLATA